MDQLNQLKTDVKALLDTKKELLKVKHRKKYTEISQTYGKIVNDDELLLKDLKPLEAQMNDLHNHFN